MASEEGVGFDSSWPIGIAIFLSHLHSFRTALMSEAARSDRTPEAISPSFPALSPSNNCLEIQFRVFCQQEHIWIIKNRQGRPIR